MVYLTTISMYYVLYKMGNPKSETESMKIKKLKMIVMTMTMTMMFLFSYVTQYKGIEENQGFTNSKNTNEQINIT